MRIGLYHCNSTSVGHASTECKYHPAMPNRIKITTACKMPNDKTILRSCRNSYLNFTSKLNPRKH